MNRIKPMPQAFQWGPFQFTDEDAEAHFLALGTTGSGKTLILRLLQQSVLSYVGQGHGYRGLCYDAKQDMYPILSAYCEPDRIKLLNPFDARGVAWDIAKDVTRSSVAMEIAFTLIPEVSDNSPFFRNAARHSAWGIMCSYMLSGHDWSFADLLRGLRDEEVCQRILQRHHQTEHLIRMYYRDPKLVNDIFATIASATMLYEPIAASWEKSSEKIALSDCMENEYIVVLGNSEVSRQTIDRLNAVLFKRWTDLILSQPDGTTKRFWTFVDELSEAGYLAGLPSFLKKARSKGGRCVVACQSIEGLRSDKMYGDKVTPDFLSCFGNRMFTRLECPETAEFCSKYIGDQEIVQTSETKSGTHSKSQSSVSYSKVVQRTVLPSEFMNIPNCGSANGLTAMYKMRSTPACWDTIPADQLFNEWLIPKAPGVEEFIPRDAMAEFLEPWSLEQESQFAPPISQSLSDHFKNNPRKDLGQSPPDIQDLDF